jgi:hypothetical protein
MDKAKLLARINESPVTQSLLYDLNLLPEQIKEGTKEWINMALVVVHIEKAEFLAVNDIAKHFDSSHRELWTPAIADEIRSLNKING